MLSILTSLLISNFLVLSDRDQFYDADKIAKTTEMTCCDFKDLKGKKVLLVVHGFNNKSDAAMQSYRVVKDQALALRDAEGGNLYDVVIGYLWPGYDDSLENYEARQHATKLKGGMKEHLKQLSANAAKIDVLAHSMGNRLMFEALNFIPEKKNARRMVQNFYALAPAIDDESIEKNQKYFHSSKNCDDIYVFHSKQEEVLGFLHTVAEMDQALRFEDLKQMPKNVQLVDCTVFELGHGQYFSSANVYDFIRNILLKKSPPCAF